MLYKRRRHPSMAVIGSNKLLIFLCANANRTAVVQASLGSYSALMAVEHWLGGGTSPFCNEHVIVTTMMPGAIQQNTNTNTHPYMWRTHTHTHNYACTHSLTCTYLTKHWVLHVTKLKVISH